MENIPEENHLNIGGIVFPQMDQIDFTGPFEVLSRIPNSTFHVLGKERAPIRDMRGLLLTPDENVRGRAVVRRASGSRRLRPGSADGR